MYVYCEVDEVSYAVILVCNEVYDGSVLSECFRLRGKFKSLSDRGRLYFD